MRLINRISFNNQSVVDRQSRLFRLVDDQGVACLTGQTLVIKDGLPVLWAEYTVGQADRDAQAGRHLVRWGACKDPRIMEGVSLSRVGPPRLMGKFGLERAMGALNETVRSAPDGLEFFHPVQVPVRGGTWNARWIDDEIRGLDEQSDMLRRFGLATANALQQFYAGRLVAHLPESRLRWAAYEAEWFDDARGEATAFPRQVWQLLQPHLLQPRLPERKLETAAAE